MFLYLSGSKPQNPSGADMIIMEAGDTYLLKSLTTKGERVESVLESSFKLPPEPDHPASTDFSIKKQKEVAVPAEVTCTEETWNLPLWEELASRCLGCGICTLLCPTCHCFEVEDEGEGSAGTRFRAWDSCMNGCFTKMASGENPRPSKLERVRQRFMHKLSYYPTKNNQVACVGCGRCSVHCPVNIDISDVMTQLNHMETQNG